MDASCRSGIGIRDFVQRRKAEGLSDGEYLFPRAKTKTFDNAIARSLKRSADRSRRRKADLFRSAMSMLTFV
jgi:hypothetical protein